MDWAVRQNLAPQAMSSSLTSSRIHPIRWRRTTSESTSTTCKGIWPGGVHRRRNTFGTLAPGSFAYDEFTLLGDFSWSDVGAIEVSVQHSTESAAIDVDITIGKISVVPEPGSIALADWPCWASGRPGDSGSPERSVVSN